MRETNGEHVVDQVEKQELQSINIVGHGAEMVQNHLGDRVSYAVQEEQLGTGRSVTSRISSKRKEGTTIVIVEHSIINKRNSFSFNGRA